MFSEEIRVSVLPDDKAALQAIATAEGEALAVVVRRYIRRGLRGESARLAGLLPGPTGHPTIARPEVLA